MTLACVGRKFTAPDFSAGKFSAPFEILLSRGCIMGYFVSRRFPLSRPEGGEKKFCLLSKINFLVLATDIFVCFWGSQKLFRWPQRFLLSAFGMWGKIISAARGRQR